MKKRIAALFLCVLMVITAITIPSFASQNTEAIVILYENDVHCAIEGYSKLSAMKHELEEDFAHVGVVSCGDYVQGSSLGVISRGEYIVNLMNLVGYDAVALGNHEFDYRLARLEELIGMMQTKPICCNFEKLNENKPYFEPYSIVTYGDVDIAYIGITTPTTISRSAPAQFEDENGEHIYTFNPETLSDVVQGYIDSAKSNGADYVIALAHIGYEDIGTLIENTDGFDVVLDAHSHSVIEEEIVTDKGGNEVVLSSTGTKFEHIGKLTISKDTIHTELIKTEDYTKTDPALDTYIEQISSEYSKLGERKVAFSEVDLITQDAEGNRLVRVAETNLGDLCADAFRHSVDADIGYINGGGLRSDLMAGDITFNDLLSVLPFNNTIVLAEVDGQTVKDMLEMAMMSWPEEGSFPHVSGITFSVNTDVPSSVELNEFEEFSGVSGPYRVYNIKVFNRETGEYEPIRLTDTYTLASHNYYLIDHGSGMKMLENAKVLQNDGMLDVEALEQYILEPLNGVIGSQYQTTSPNITFTEGELPSAGQNNSLPMFIGIAVAFVLLLLIFYFVIRGMKKAKKNG